MKRKMRLIQFLVLKSLETLRARFTMILAPCADVRSSGLPFSTDVSAYHTLSLYVVACNDFHCASC